MILALVLIFIAQTPAAAPAKPAPRIEDVGERRVFEEAQRALEADESLLSLHRGMRAFLRADDGLRQAEESYDAMMEISSLRERVEDFEEALIADGAARTDYQRFAARAQRDPALRDAMDGLGAIETETRPGASELSRSFAYLRAHPETAIPFLMRGEQGGSGPADLRPLVDAIRSDVTVQHRLREVWTRLDALAGAREAVYPWWARAYGGGTAAAKRFLALDAALARFPSLRRAWEARELAWATRPEAVAWRDYVYARVRRDPALGPVYFGYLHTLRTHPEIEKYVDEAFAAKHGAPLAWPPQGTPPRLAAWQRPESITRPGEPVNPDAPSLDEPSLDRPERPTINRPTSPNRPVAPERAQKPVAP